jgi:hypothetical protein
LYEHIERIKKEVLAIDLKKGQLPGAYSFSHSIGGEKLSITVAMTTGDI